MMMEKRMLDAWADGRLVLVKLDNGFLPVGVRDLATIDASFESGRKLAFWPQVERAAREIINRALTERSDKFWSASPPPKPDRSSGGNGSGMFGSRKKEATPTNGAASAAAPEPQAPPAAELEAAPRRPASSSSPTPTPTTQPLSQSSQRSRMPAAMSGSTREASVRARTGPARSCAASRAPRASW